MNEMFKGARDFNQNIPSWNWNVGENTILNNMFGDENIDGVVYECGIYTNDNTISKTPTPGWFNNNNT